MHNWNRALIAAAALLAASPDALRAAEPAALEGFESPVDFIAFEAGDRVAFLGDSITASGDYVHMIRLFYATRFPDRPVRFYNCGIGGARAETSWPRLDTDCLDLNPTRVVIMLGMNDTGGAIKKRQDAMTRIMDRIAEKPERKLALIVSSPYDQTAEFGGANALGKNDTIRRFGAWLIEQGRERKAPVIDFNTPMLQVNKERQKADPAFSVIGRDRIHPGVRGHAVMTYCFVRAQGIEGPVARVEVDARTGFTRAVNASVKELETSASKQSFVYRPKALPYPAEALPFESPDGEWAPFTEDLNREWLVVRGLEKGRWALSMDGQSVGEFTAEEMAKGIDLAREARSPSYRHAQEVLALARQVEMAERNLRAVARVRWIILAPRNIDIDDRERADAAVRDYLARRPKHAYWQSRAGIFFRLRSSEKRKAERVRMEGLMTRLYEINKPKPQRVELQAVPASAGTAAEETVSEIRRTRSDFVIHDPTGGKPPAWKGPEDRAARRPAYLARGEFRPDAHQPGWFSKPKLFIDNDAVRWGPPGRERLEAAAYVSLTEQDGRRILWYPDRKSFLLGKYITDAWLDVMVVPR